MATDLSEGSTILGGFTFFIASSGSFKPCPVRVHTIVIAPDLIRYLRNSFCFFILNSPATEAALAGSTKTRARRHTQSGKRSRMRGACTTCMGTCGNGVRIGMGLTIMGSRRRAIRRDLLPAYAACIAAAAGSIRRGAAGRRIEATTRRAAATAIWASGWL